MKILITGSTGFIGKHLLNNLEKGPYHLGLLVRERGGCPKSTPRRSSDPFFIQGDLANFDLLRGRIAEFSPDVCIHLAWDGVPDYSLEWAKKNLHQSINLVDFLVRETHCKKIIMSGSCYEYGRVLGACKESDKTKTTSYIAWAKQSLFNYSSLLCKEFSRDLIWFRLFYVYGPGQRSDALVPSVVNTYRRGEVPAIKNPYCSHDFIYIEDVVKAFELSLEMKVKSGIYNLGTGRTTSVLDICKWVAEKMDCSNLLGAMLLTKPKDAVDFWADMKRFERAFEWNPKISVEEGMRRYIVDLLQNSRTVDNPAWTKAY